MKHADWKKQIGIRDILLPCECNAPGHSLFVMTFADEPGTCYVLQDVNILSIWARIKAATRLLWSGRLTSGETVLNEDSVKRLVEFLNQPMSTFDRASDLAQDKGRKIYVYSWQGNYFLRCAPPKQGHLIAAFYPVKIPAPEYDMNCYRAVVE